MSRKVIAPFMLAATISFTACGGSSKSSDTTIPPVATNEPAPTPAEATPENGQPTGTEMTPGASDRQPVSGSTTDCTGEVGTGKLPDSGENKSPDATNGSGAPSAAGSSAALTEPAIFGILGAANQTEISAAKLAVQKSKSKQVKSFAKEMIAAHTQMLAAGDKTAKKLSITPEETADVKSLKDDATTALEKLRGLDGTDFDRAYMAQMVSDHEKVLTVIDNQIMPAASSNAQIQALVKGARPKVESHLEHARALNDKLNAAK